MFIQHVPPPPSGWASASVMKDRHGEKFTRPSLSQTPALLRHLCPCFLSHCRDFPSPCLSQLSWALITIRSHPNEVALRLDSVCPSFSTWEGRAIALKNTSLQKQTYPTPTSPCCLDLPDCC